MNGATIHGGNGNMINGGWEKAEEKPAHPWSPGRRWRWRFFLRENHLDVGQNGRPRGPPFC